MRAAAPCMHHHLLPSERNRRCSALHPGQALPTSIDCHQVICFAVSPCCSLTHQRACSKQPRHVTRRLSQYFLPSRLVCTYVCQRSSVGCQSVCQGTALCPAGRANPGPCVSPVGRRFWTFWFSRRADPDRQSDDGRPLLFRSAMPPRLRVYSTFVCPVICCRLLVGMHA